MKILRPLTDAEVVSTFIRAELNSQRFRTKLLNVAKALGVSEVELLDSNTADDQLNENRRDVLVHARPGIMKTLPDDVVWHEVLLSAEEWLRIQYINDEPWAVFSDNTRLVSLGATKALQEPDRTIHQRMIEIHKKMQHGERIEKIILLADPGLTKIVVVEGHVRATSYVALGIHGAAEIPVVLGTSQHPEKWSLY